MMSLRINELFASCDKKRVLRAKRKAKEARENFYRSEEMKKMKRASRQESFKRVCAIYDECLA